MELALEGLAFEAWRRVAAAVTEACSHPAHAHESPRIVPEGHAKVSAVKAARPAEAERGLNSTPMARRASTPQPAASPEDNNPGGLNGGFPEGRGGFVVDDYSPLEAADYAAQQDPRAGPLGREGVDAGASTAALPHVAAEADVASRAAPEAPARPLDELLELMGALEGGVRVSVADAVAMLGGDAQRLARLVSGLGCPSKRRGREVGLLYYVSHAARHGGEWLSGRGVHQALGRRAAREKGGRGGGIKCKRFGGQNLGRRYPVSLRCPDVVAHSAWRLWQDPGVPVRTALAIFSPPSVSPRSFVVPQLDLGVLRLRPRTALTVSSLSTEGDHPVLGGQSSAEPWALGGAPRSSCPSLLPEADVAFEVSLAWERRERVLLSCTCTEASASVAT